MSVKRVREDQVCKFLVCLLCVTWLVTACGPAAALTLAATSAPLAATRVPATNTPPPTSGGPTGDLTLTIFYDNTAHDAHLHADWGLAALIEYGSHTLLFDTGANGQMLVSNMDKLGIDSKKIEAIS